MRLIDVDVFKKQIDTVAIETECLPEEITTVGTASRWSLNEPQEIASAAKVIIESHKAEQQIPTYTHIGIDMSSGTDMTAFHPISDIGGSIMEGFSMGMERSITNARESIFGLTKPQKSNNWLKMHGYPKQRRIKKQFLKAPGITEIEIPVAKTEDGKYSGIINGGEITIESGRESEE